MSTCTSITGDKFCMPQDWGGALPLVDGIERGAFRLPLTAVSLLSYEHMRHIFSYHTYSAISRAIFTQILTQFVQI